MNPTMQRYVKKLNGMSVRERLAVFFAVLALLAFVAHSLFIGPTLTRQQAIASRMEQQRMETSALQTQIQTLQQRTANPDAGTIARRDDARRQIAEIENTLRDMQHKLVPAQSMKTVLQDMLMRNARLQLVAMR